MYRYHCRLGKAAPVQYILRKEDENFIYGRRFYHQRYAIFILETLICSHTPSSLTCLFISPKGTHCFIGTTAERAYIYGLVTSPPMYCAAVNTAAAWCEVDWNIGLIVTAGDSGESGKLALHKFSLGEDVKITPIMANIEIGKGSSCVKFSQSRSEVYIGYTNGSVGVVSLRNFTRGLICKLCVSRFLQGS